MKHVFILPALALTLTSCMPHKEDGSTLLAPAPAALYVFVPPAFQWESAAHIRRFDVKEWDTKPNGVLYATTTEGQLIITSNFTLIVHNP